MDECEPLVTGGASAPFELNMGAKHFAAGAYTRLLFSST